jgi:hypothetical protein
MKKIILFIFLFLAPVSLFAETSRNFAGALTFMIGDVFVSHDKTNWVNADFDMKIYQGDQITV